MSGKGISFEEGAENATGNASAYFGKLHGKGCRFGLVVSRFNSVYTKALLKGAERALREHGTDSGAWDVAWVPGAFEIPLVIDRWAASSRYHALLALGCVIEGETQHADLIGRQVTQALSNISLRYHIPVIDEVVTTRNEAQAASRCRSDREGRGWYAGCAALEMANLFRQMEKDGR